MNSKTQAQMRSLKAAFKSESYTDVLMRIAEIGDQLVPAMLMGKQILIVDPETDQKQELVCLSD